MKKLFYKKYLLLLFAAKMSFHRMFITQATPKVYRSGGHCEEIRPPLEAEGKNLREMMCYRILRGCSAS
jgi:hypothetical protein